MNCRLCEVSDMRELVYKGKIRSGGVGSDFIDGYFIYRCKQCHFVSLDPMPDDLTSFYETEEYRSRFDYSYDVESIHRKYAHEQTARITRIGVENIREKVILDLGSSAGVFLDVVQSSAKRTIAVEPAKIFKSYLLGRGHTHYSYPENAIAANEVVDLVTSFDVIEHLVDPKLFIKNAEKLLVPGGTFILSMPNMNDLLLKLNFDSFAPFFFQISHLNYFSESVIPKLFEGTKFKNIKIGYLHKYGIENAMQWAIHGKPGLIQDQYNIFDDHFNTLYINEIERLGIASHLFIKAEKNL
jgi:2-polyprenyl-3-methyl-5-hydroxy-6-metoxy-1,4-benzoquinol methylase